MWVVDWLLSGSTLPLFKCFPVYCRRTKGGALPKLLSHVVILVIGIDFSLLEWGIIYLFIRLTIKSHLIKLWGDLDPIILVSPKPISFPFLIITPSNMSFILSIDAIYCLYRLNLLAVA